MKTHRLELLADARDHLPRGAELLAFGADPEGTLCILGRGSREPRRRGSSPSQASFPKSRMDGPQSYTLATFRAGMWRSVALPEIGVAPHFVQPTPGGALVVGARAQWRAEGPEHNAVALDLEGRILTTFCLGDGLNHVRVSPSGAIWAGYFDEGVFGNLGWGHPGPAPLGAAGLVRYSPEGEARWAYESEVAGTDMICDLYALNVASDAEAWVYAYTDFDLVHIRGGGYEVWRAEEGAPRGASAVAVLGRRARLIGDYEGRDVCRTYALESRGRMALVSEVRLLGPGGEALEGAVYQGVGGMLYALHEGRILADLTPASTPA